MDNYIYYRVLNHLVKHGYASRSELILATRSVWRKNPLPFLHTRGFIERTKGEIKGVVYYKLTDQGLLLHSKMDQFYSQFDNMLRSLNTRLQITIKQKGF